MNRNIAILTAIASFAITLSLGNSASAQAVSYYIRLDNQANGATLSWAGTDDTVSVYVTYTGDGTGTQRFVGSRVLDSIAPNHDFYPASGSTADFHWSTIDSIIVKINGGNMFWLDEIELFPTSGGGYVWKSGGDNTEGRCFSTQANDYVGYETWCAPNSSNPDHEYDVW